MMRVTIKNMLVGTVLSVVLTTQMATPVFALTNDEVLASAQAGIGYLEDNQNSDGSIAGYGGETEWSVVAIESSGQDASSAVDFLKSNAPAPTAPATDIERRIIAISASGNDVTDFGGEDYKAKLLSQHNNDQIGDTTLLNDDIFGLIASSSTKDTDFKPMAQDALDYFLAHQVVDGGFSYTTNSCMWCGSDSNDTAAAIIAMNSAGTLGLTNINLDTAKDSAIIYLLSTQQSDGGFGYDIYSPSDGSSTAWGLMALNSIGDSVRVQAAAARDWILAHQNSDGGFGYVAYGTVGSDTYTTAHSVIALLGTTWLLDPAPLKSATPVVAPTVQPKTVATSTNPKQAPMPATVTNNAQNEPEVLGVTQESTPTAPAQTQSTKTKPQVAKLASAESKANGNNYSAYAAATLAFLAFGWFGLQSIKTPKGI